MSNLVPYFLARHIAADLDRQGKQPGVFLRAFVGLGALCVAVALAAIAFGVLEGLLWNLGLIS